MESHPYFSIVIPTYNRPERLQKCLESIAQLDYPRDRFEVVVVDDGSQMPLEPITQPFLDQFSLTLIRQNNAGPASARNTGAAAAQGDYLAFTDDDCQPDPQWLLAFSQSVSEAPDALVGGYTVNALPANPYSTASQLLIDYLYCYYNHSPDKSAFFASNNFAVPRELYHKLEGFDTSFPLAAGEDREFCDRWHYHGYATRFTPDARVYHAHQLQLNTFWRQHRNYGRGAYYYHQIRAQRQSGRIKVESLKFYWNVLTFPLQHKTNHSVLVISSLLFLSQLANVTGFFSVRSSKSSAKVASGLQSNPS